MVREIALHGRVIKYNFEYKSVKNINLRIKQDGCVYVSANRFTKVETIESFMKSKADFILNAVDKYSAVKQENKTQYFTENELKELIAELCDKAYPYYREKGIAYPQIKFRKMVSMWGNCYHKRGILTFNTNLIYAPFECIEYVVWHEFTHFLEPNHSERFYKELSKVYPNWKNARAKLKGIVLR